MYICCNTHQSHGLLQVEVLLQLHMQLTGIHSHINQEVELIHLIAYHEVHILVLQSENIKSKYALNFHHNICQDG